MDVKKALSRAAAYCSRQERCVYDVKRKLEAWEVDPEKFGAIIETLVKEKFIDEERYSLFYARDKFRFNGWGRVKISYSLKQKGIPGDVIQKALSEIDETEYGQKLFELLKNKLKQIKDKNDRYKVKAAMIRFAQSRGFEPDRIYSVVEKLI